MSEFKKCKVIMLPTERHRDAIVQREGRLFTYNSKDSFKNDRKWHTSKYFNLYITSDEEIKEGDWVLHLGNPIFQFNESMSKFLCEFCRKIVATTDTKLLPIPNKTYNKGEYLSKIPESFIKQYCEAGGIDEVMLEIVRLTYDDWMKTAESQPEYRFKTDSNNCIIIKPIKKSWTREEVEALLYKHTEDMFKQRISLEDWISQNL